MGSENRKKSLICWFETAVLQPALGKEGSDRRRPDLLAPGELS